MKPKTKVVSAILSLVMLSGAAMGCSKGGENTNTSSSSEPSAITGTASYPIKTDKKLTYWGEYITVKPNMSEVPFFQEWQKRTGVPITFISPPAGQEKEGLNVLLASGDLPDMMEYDWFSFPGGPEKAISDGYILRLNDAIDKYAPNLKKYLKEHPEVDKMVKTDNGSYYTFPFIRGDAMLQVYQGPIVRKDWLDELGLKVPETIDDYYNVLKAFKEKKGVTVPLSFTGIGQFNNGAFVGAYGTNRGFFEESGKVLYGPMQSGYKEFLTTMRKWYAEGLLDKNIAAVDGKTLDANITSGATGITIGNAGGGIGKWTPVLKEKDPKAILAPAPYPVLNKGETPKFGQKDHAYTTYDNVAISGNSKNVELAVRLLDWGYSEEGHMFYNFGQEGVSYKMENGYPKYTDLLMKNPEKLAPAQAMSLYIRANSGGPFVQDKRYIEQYLTLPEQQEAIKIWAKTDSDKYSLGLSTSTSEESSELAKIMNDVNTLMDEMTLKIILGTEPVDAYDKYMEKLKSLKIDRALQIKQSAYDRYLKR
ncbi:extracellular solute-binding protein [Paenibacillus sedimenti]|uniref:Extracellular solute-binding protein n=1 Tax=Paenibacillus sedimenti TaxID=2770274 RepID=A0A926KM76_9BACL|nr:extracellular solute-binding protein [Paenibacillus sedimenti]MBD0378704.1 extracellular solute-binding protein [Paenibacillus sedimenti]